MAKKPIPVPADYTAGLVPSGPKTPVKKRKPPRVYEPRTARELAKPKTVVKTNIVSVAGPGGDAGYRPPVPKQKTQPPSPAHPLAPPKPPPVAAKPAPVAAAPAPVPAKIAVVPHATQTAATPQVGTKQDYYTTKAQAQADLPPDVPGAAVKFTTGKGYYIATPTASAPTARAAAAPTVDPVAAELAAQVDPLKASINNSYQQLLDQLKAEQAKAAQDARDQATTSSGYYNALAPILGGIAPAVQQGYQDAANSLGGLAKGFSGALGDSATASANAASALLAQNGAPAGQTAATTAAAGGPGLGNALYGLGGYVPGAELGAQGAAFGAAARNLPSMAAGVGAQNAAQALAQGAVTDKEWQGKIAQAATTHANDLAELALKVPGLRNQIEAALADQNLKQQQVQFEQALAAKQYGLKVNDQQFNQAATTAKITIASRQETRAQAALDLNTMKTLSEITGTVYGADGQPQLDKNGRPVLSASGRKAALAEWKATHPAAKGGFTKNQLASIAKRSEQMADTQFYGKKDANGKVVAYAVPDYQQALQQQLAAGVPLTVAQRALNAFYPPGQEGRPWVPVQSRDALAQAGLPLGDPMGKPNATQQAWLRAHGLSFAA